MGDFFNWLSTNPVATTTFLVGAGLLFLTVTAVFLIAFRQGREITFWPPRIGPRTGPGDRPIEKTRARKGQLSAILNFEGNVLIARSVVKGDRKRYVRDPDAQVTGYLTEYIKGEIEYEGPLDSLDRPASHLIAIGSTRYNAHAELIQRGFDLPCQYVLASVGAEPGSSILKIITEYGDELVSSVDHGLETHNEESDYGILFIGNLTQGKKVLWISGVHGVGTTGVFKYLRENAHTVLAALSTEDNTGTSWLIRTKYIQAQDDSRPDITDVELLGNPRVCTRHAWPRRPKALISDLGNVIMYFDRSRTYRAIAHILDVPHQVIQERIERTTIREAYELGKLSDEAFLAALREAAGAQDPALTDAFLTEFWGDIFWPNNEMIGALHQLKKGNLFLVMLSNTNHIHFAHVMKDYPELDSLFDEFVLSYEVGSNKPHHEIFARGIKTVVDQDPRATVEDILFVDDKAEFVRIAENLGLKAHMYRSYPHFVFWLRKMGVYLP